MDSGDHASPSAPAVSATSCGSPPHLHTATHSCVCLLPMEPELPPCSQPAVPILHHHPQRSPLRPPQFSMHARTTTSMKPKAEGRPSTGTAHGRMSQSQRQKLANKAWSNLSRDTARFMVHRYIAFAPIRKFLRNPRRERSWGNHAVLMAKCHKACVQIDALERDVLWAADTASTLTLSSRRKVSERQELLTQLADLEHIAHDMKKSMWDVMETLQRSEEAGDAAGDAAQDAEEPGTLARSSVSMNR